MVDTLTTQMTAAEFFDLPETNQPTQLIDGELIVAASPIPYHQKLSGRFFKGLENIIPNGEVYFSPLDLYLDDANVPQPDLIWVAADGRCLITPKRFEGPPELIIEILSPGTARVDKIRKYRLYERHGVSEYWIVNAEERYVEVFTLVDGRYSLYGVFDEETPLTSPRLGATLDLKAIFT
ncbi:MAG: Uma2 family endonuclease [Anaerolineae bacterium]|nr:Uma2 family endonuclease [Anaerolineae bacterium]